MAIDTDTGQPPAEPPRRALKRREREILDTAAEIFHRKGYADTSVQDVADAVGILKGSLYYYIESKEDLLFRVLLEVHEDARSLVDEVKAMDAPPLERLRAYIRGHIEYDARNLAKIAVYYHDYDRLSPERRKVIRRQRALYEDLVISLITEAQERGEVDPDLDARLVSNAVFGVANWIYTWFRPDGAVDPEHLGRLYAELLVKGIAGASAPERSHDGAATRRAGRR